MTEDDTLKGEAEIVAVLRPLTEGLPGAFALKDDCAALTPTPGTDLVLKTDAVAEGVHFLHDDDPRDIGWKALAVNVSDLAAKGARPLVYLMAISFPSAPTRRWMVGFAAGLAEAQSAFGIHLAGGDTDRRRGPISIALTVIGEVPSGGLVRRDTALPGDVLFVSGTLGDAALGLQVRTDATRASVLGLDGESACAVLARYLRPSPRLALAAVLRTHARAAMDLSDGLAKDLGRMAAASGTGAIVRVEDLPLSAAMRRAVTVEGALVALAVAAGDDYEVLAAVSRERADAFAADAAAAGVVVTRIGVMTERVGNVAFVGGDGQPIALASTGWDHF